MEAINRWSFVLNTTSYYDDFYPVFLSSLSFSFSPLSRFSLSILSLFFLNLIVKSSSNCTKNDDELLVWIFNQERVREKTFQLISHINLALSISSFLLIPISWNHLLPLLHFSFSPILIPSHDLKWRNTISLLKGKGLKLNEMRSYDQVSIVFFYFRLKRVVVLYSLFPASFLIEMSRKRKMREKARMSETLSKWEENHNHYFASSSYPLRIKGLKNC